MRVPRRTTARASACSAVIRSGPAALSLLVAGSVLLAGCGSTASGARSPAPSASSGSPAPSSASGSSDPAPSSSAAPTPSAPATSTEPGGSARLLPGNRIVAFYGAAGTASLGVLGSASADGIWPRLAAQAAAYAQSGTRVLPAYELITDVIQGSPGVDGDYSVQVADATVEQYVQAAHAHHALLILDIQPGRTSFLPLAERLAKYLEDPDVGLALDPEWRLAPGQVPDAQIGSVSAAEINQTSAWLASLTTRYHLPQKMLLIHQFTDDEIVDKAAVVARPQLATVFNMDGFGGRAAKLSKYKDLAADTRFGLGLKLFYKQDVDIFTPAQTLALSPAPNVIDYE